LSTVVAIAILLVFGLSAAFVVRGARQGTIDRRLLLALSLLCALGLVAMTMSDWPAELLDRFWADHSVLSATLSTLLLVGSGYLAFEAQDNLKQQHLTESLAAAAYGGLVDHVLDVDVAMAYLAGATAPPGYTFEGKPLRWLRPLRNELRSEVDPRSRSADTWATTKDSGWRRDLVDQAVRRVMGAMRDWGPLLCQSRDGTAVLVQVGVLRNLLLEVGDHLGEPRSDEAEAQSLALRIRATCTVLALGLELGSNVAQDRVRPGVLSVAPALLPGTAKPLERLCELAANRELRRLRSELPELVAPSGRAS